MRLVRFLAEGRPEYGVFAGDSIHALAEDPFVCFATNRTPTLKRPAYPLTEIKLLPPCLPSKLVCLGLNYRPHAAEANRDVPTSPIIFIKPSTSVIGPDEPIVMPRRWIRVDYECELGVVIGKKAKFVPPERWREYVLGFTCVNDVTERQFQRDDGQWTRAKGFDTFAPLGPWIETEIDPSDLKIETVLNGEVRQSDRTSGLVFDVPSLVGFITEVMTLLPGDVISTGTPAGIGPMRGGDIVEVKIERIGILRNPVAEATV